MSDRAPGSTVAAADAAAPPSWSVDPADHELQYETRLAVVMYGGVSLAIYINGVAQELLHMVRATAGAKRNPDPLTPVEEIYREVGCRLGTADPLSPEAGKRIRMRILVDVLSGTSAGGLNGIFLAKALANGRTMESLKRLWIEQGDVDLLLNDQRSTRESLGWLEAATRRPESLLNSRRMGAKLLDALTAMRGPGSEDPGEPRLADELDLFVTATDLTGVATPVQIADRVVYERRHKAVFHFLGAMEEVTGGSVNDFARENDGFLAFAGRCTSSFPLAFEPMRLLETFEVFKKTLGVGPDDAALHRWARFYSEYLQPEDPGRRLTVEELQSKRRSFAERSFGDGGYLDNKPFSHAIGALRWRQAGPHVARKLVYIEPSPDHPERRQGVRPKPNAFENLRAAAFELPRNETIREDLERVLERNRKIEHVKRSIRFIPDDLGSVSRPLQPLSGDDFARQGLAALVKRAGAPYGAYHRLKVAELTTELAEVVTRVSGLDEKSEDLQAVRTMLSAWRQEFYDAEDPGDPAKDLPPHADTLRSRRARRLPDLWTTESRFLMDFDLSYRLRRLYFVMDTAYGLLSLESKPREGKGAMAPRYSLDRAPELLSPTILDIRDLGGIDTCRQQLGEFRKAVSDVLQVLQSAYRALRIVGRKLRARGGASPLAEPLEGLHLSRSDCHEVLLPRRGSQRVQLARETIGLAPPRVTGSDEAEAIRARRKELLESAATIARKHLVDAFRAASDSIDRVLPTASELDKSRPRDAKGAARWIAQRCLRFYYDSFETYDLALFPMVYGTEVGELAEVDVIRVSPEDATGLVSEIDSSSGDVRLRKLAGRRMQNFGAFLDPVWRRSDMLWGRLDAAEVLLEQLLPRCEEDSGQAIRTGLIRRAQVAILEEELVPLGAVDGRRVLVEAFMHTERKATDPTALHDFLETIGPYLEERPRLRDLLEPRAVMKALGATFETTPTLPPKTSYRLGARAVAILGRIFEGLQGSKGGVHSKMGRYLALASGAVWGFVEMAIPEGIGPLLVRQWITILYGLEVLLILGGCAPSFQRVGDLGWALLLATAMLHAVHSALRVQFSGSNRVWKALRVLAVWLFVGVAAWGLFSLPEFPRKLRHRADPLLRYMGFLAPLGASPCPCPDSTAKHPPSPPRLPASRTGP